MAGGCRSAPLPRGTWQPLGAEGCSGTPRGEQDGGHRAARTHPHLPPAPRLDLSSGKENGSGGEPRQEGLRAGGGAVGWGAGTPLWLSPPRAPLRALRVSLPGALPCRCAADGGRDGGVEPGERRAGGGTDHPGRAAVLHGRRAGDPRGGCGPGARCPRTRRALGTTAGALPSQAIQNPGDLRLQERAWSAVCPLVAKLKRFYEFSLRLGERLTSPASPAVHPASLPAGRNGTGCGSPGRGVCAQLGMPSRASVSPPGVGRCRGGPGVLCPQRTPCGACWRPSRAPPTPRPALRGRRAGCNGSVGPDGPSESSSRAAQGVTGGPKAAAVSGLGQPARQPWARETLGVRRGLCRKDSLAGWAAQAESPRTGGGDPTGTSVRAPRVKIPPLPRTAAQPVPGAGPLGRGFGRRSPAPAPVSCLLCFVSQTLSSRKTVYG